MAYPKLAVFPDGTTMEVDDAEEAADARARGANIRSMSSADGKGTGTRRKRSRRQAEPDDDWAPDQSIRRRVAGLDEPPRSRRGRGRGQREYSPPENPDAPISFGQATLIGAAGGGFAAICPQVEAMRQEEGVKVSWKQFFDVVAPGMTAGVAHEILNALSSEGLIVGRFPKSRTPEDRRKAARAREIIASFGLTCPVTFDNPSRRRRL
jgi:hypothetical protein